MITTAATNQARSASRSTSTAVPKSIFQTRYATAAAVRISVPTIRTVGHERSCEDVEGQLLVRDGCSRDRGRLAGSVVRRADLDDVVPGEREIRGAHGRTRAPRGCVNPPASGVPVPGANAGSRTSTSNERKSGPSPTRARTRAPYSSGLSVTSSSHGITSKPSSRGISASSGPVDRAPHPCEQRPAGIDEPLLERPAKRRAVVVALAAVDVPDVGVCVEQDDAERPVHRGVRPELAEHDAGDRRRGRASARRTGRSARAARRSARPSSRRCRASRGRLPGRPPTVARRPAPLHRVVRPQARSTPSESPPGRTERQGGSWSRCRRGSRAPPRRRPPGRRRAGSGRRS